MYSWYNYLIVNLDFSQLRFWSVNLFLIAPFPERCLLVPFYILSLPEIKPNYDTGQRNFRKLSNYDDIKQSNEQGLLLYKSPTILDQLANLHSETLCDLAPIPCGNIPSTTIYV